MLKINGLRKSWPNFDLRVDLELRRGEIAAMLGPSGSGKSTLLRLVAGLESPDSGSVAVSGRDVTTLPPERRGIGMVFQDFALFPHLSVRRNIEYGPRMKGLSRSGRHREAVAIAASFEIEGLLDRSPRSLSGGEAQRVALARALAGGPSVLLLDEPLSSLDAALRLRLRAEIAKRLREAGMTALLVTHDAKEALAVSDRIFLMRSGSIDSSGDPESLYDSPPTAWSAAFLGRGPVLEILSLKSEQGSPVAETPIGSFACSTLASASREASELSLFFPAEAPRIAAPSPAIPGGTMDVARNRFSGRVLSSSFEGDTRRVSLACPLIADPRATSRHETAIELIIPSGARPVVGEMMEFTVFPECCLALPGRDS
jgi:ABC-type Fe3+/spermidine/putrescine transport system ATPase subunit